jgi:hypothetical protein
MMQRGISYQGFLPVRRESSSRAGMISQVLFGERFTILKKEGAWLLIATDSDSIEGWVERRGTQPAKEADGSKKEAQPDEWMVVHPCVKVMDTRYDRPLLLPAGSVLKRSGPGTTELESERFLKQSDEGWIVPGANNDPEKVGRGLLSIPGLSGGRCGFGMDAPGLAQLLCRAMGISLPHSINGQSAAGSIIHFIHEARKGDLAFFHDTDDQFTHVGMVLDDGKIIHAADQVRLDRLDQQGIYCVEKGEYTHRLRIVKSMQTK